MSDNSHEITFHFFKSGDDLIAYDGEQFYKVKSFQYRDPKTALVTTGFQFIEVEKGDK